MFRKTAEQTVRKIAENEALDKVTSPAAAWVTSVTSSRQVKNLLSGTWLGHPLHPMLTDIPLGAWVAASALDLTSGRRNARAARRLVALGVLSVLPTAASGASDWAGTDGPPQRIGLAHAVGNSVGAALQATSWVARVRGRRGLGIVLSLAGLSATLGASYLGGHLTLVRGVGVNHAAFDEGTDTWTDVAAESDITDSTPLRAEVGEVPVVIVRVDGVLRALSATCTHAGGPLDEGTVDDGCIQCPWHGSRFRLVDGEVEHGPASVAQPAWDVGVADGRVRVRART